MPIETVCVCGKKLRANDELAGRKVKCPGCGQGVALPAPNDAIVAAPPPLPKPPPLPPPPVAPIQAQLLDEPELADDEDEDDRDDDRPRRKKKKKKKGHVALFDKPSNQHGRGGDVWFESTNAGLIGGIVMVVVGVLIFVGLLLVGWIWPYPLIISVIGFIAIIKALVD